MTWQDFRAAIGHQWSQVSQLATWAMRTHYAHDAARMPGMEKLPPAPKTYLYPEARKHWPEIPSTTVAAVLNSVSAKYRAQRRGVLWTLDQQLSVLRYPQPFIAPAASWSVAIDDTDRRDIALSVRLGGDRIGLRLRGGKDFSRQRRQIEMLCDGRAIRGELAIYRKRAAGTDRAGRHGQESSAIGIDRDHGGQRIHYDVMAKLVGYFPVTERSGAQGTLTVRTDAQSLLVALDVKDERLWLYHGDQLRRWCAEHLARLNRWSDDTKAEQRPVPSFGTRRSEAARKFRNRINSTTSEIASQLLAFAVRRHYGEIRYDDSNKQFVSRFDWSGLKTKIENKCRAAGVTFTAASEAVQT